MNGVILAAGHGTRMLPLTEQLPKALLPVCGGRTCLEIALDALAPAVDSVVVITGYLGERIESYVKTRPWRKPVRVAHNPEHERGNLLSLAAARLDVEDDGLILTNADHLFPPDFYTRYFPDGEEITVAGQNDRPILADEMKVQVNDEGRLRAIGKTLSNAQGAYIGATRVAAGAAAAFWTAFDRVYARADLDEACVENVLAELAGGDASPRVVWVNAARWFEVDTPDDLAIARKSLG